MASFLQLFLAFFGTYALTGAIYCMRLYWPSITARLNWLIAPLCVVAFWPAILWSEVEHAVKEKTRRRTSQIAAEEYLIVADLSEERRRRGHAS